MYTSIDVDFESRKRKPNVILFHNKNKVGVNCFNQTNRHYATRSACRKCPLAVWENILDISAINANVSFAKSNGKRTSRRQSIFQ